jgi:lysophospholipase L1-like esterase
MVLFNVPRFNWPDVLLTSKDYQQLDIQLVFESWANNMDVEYHDTLPALIGKDIRKYRISDTDIHFNDAGHQLMAKELFAFVESLISRPGNQGLR